MKTLLSSVFGAVVSARNSMYDRGTFRTHHLAGPVISVGNISVGGAGKTPFVIMLGELLKARGITFNVLSRGYGRQTTGVLLVDGSGSPAQFGDEPILIARKLGVSVIVGEDRYQAGLFAENKFGPVLHVLDDGFQHRRLARDYDIVLVAPEDANDRLLPIGRLRERISSLRRADAVALTVGASIESGCRTLVAQRQGASLADTLPLEGKLVMRVSRGMEPKDVPGKPLAFCAIGRPESFFAQLREARIDLAATKSFRDHHAYKPPDIGVLQQLARAHDANGFVTTEKDAINLGPLAQRLRPLSVVPAVMTLQDAHTVIEQVLAKVTERHDRRAG